MRFTVLQRPAGPFAAGSDPRHPSQRPRCSFPPFPEACFGARPVALVQSRQLDHLLFPARRGHAPTRCTAWHHSWRPRPTLASWTHQRQSSRSHPSSPHRRPHLPSTFPPASHCPQAQLRPPHPRRQLHLRPPRTVNEGSARTVSRFTRRHLHRIPSLAPPSRRPPRPLAHTRTTIPAPTAASPSLVSWACHGRPRCPFPTPCPT